MDVNELFLAWKEISESVKPLGGKEILTICGMLIDYASSKDGVPAGKYMQLLADVSKETNAVFGAMEV